MVAQADSKLMVAKSLAAGVQQSIADLIGPIIGVKTPIPRETLAGLINITLLGAIIFGLIVASITIMQAFELF